LEFHRIRTRISSFIDQSFRPSRITVVIHTDFSNHEWIGFTESARRFIDLCAIATCHESP
jgi:hypothetical protein